MRSTKLTKHILALSATILLNHCTTDKVDSMGDLEALDNQAVQVTQEPPTEEEGKIPGELASKVEAVDVNTPTDTTNLALDQQATPNSEVVANGVPTPSDQNTASLEYPKIDADQATIQERDPLLPTTGMEVGGAAIPAQVSVPMDKGSSSASRGTNEKIYIVQAGDTVSQISSTIFGTSRRWRELAELNQLGEGARIHPGDILKYTADSHSAEYEAKVSSIANRSITVKKKDTLSSLAKELFGKSSDWKILWKWNESKISDPNKIRPGQDLVYGSSTEYASISSPRKNLKYSH